MFTIHQHHTTKRVVYPQLERSGDLNYNICIVVYVKWKNNRFVMMITTSYENEHESQRVFTAERARIIEMLKAQQKGWKLYNACRFFFYYYYFFFFHLVAIILLSFVLASRQRNVCRVYFSTHKSIRSTKKKKII